MPRHHMRILIEMISNMNFKSVMPQLEAVAATYAMAV